jgi:flagellar biosynthesis regulator FlaF
MKRILTVILALEALSFPLAAEPSAPKETPKLPPQAAIVRGVLVPVPRMIFQTLDRYAHSNWRAVQRTELARWRPPGDQAQNALLLGAVIAEGFIAVEAEDATETKNLGRAVLKQARALGVEKAALRRSRSIMDHAESAEWSSVRKEWDGVLPDVQRGMNELRSDQLAQLVSLGGWLRGMEALAVLVSQDYSEEDSRLLRQPVLFDYFEQQLAEMNVGLRTNPIVVKMSEGIRKVRRLLGSGDAPIPAKKAAELSGVLAELVKSLNR